jgi:hypothetical protein
VGGYLGGHLAFGLEAEEEEPASSDSGRPAADEFEPVQ